MKYIFFLLTPIFLFAPAHSESLTPLSPSDHIGTYSNVTYGNQEGYSGYMVGVEITVLKASNCGGCDPTPYVILQCAQGTPGVPATFPANISGNIITFQIPELGTSECTNEKTYFTGTFSDNMLIGRFGSYGTIKLKRSRSFWDRETTK